MLNLDVFILIAEIKVHNNNTTILTYNYLILTHKKFPAFPVNCSAVKVAYGWNIQAISILQILIDVATVTLLWIKLT